MKQYFYSNLQKDLWNGAEQSWKANILCIRNKVAATEALHQFHILPFCLFHISYLPSGAMKLQDIKTCGEWLYLNPFTYIHIIHHKIIPKSKAYTWYLCIQGCSQEPEEAFLVFRDFPCNCIILYVVLTREHWQWTMELDASKSQNIGHTLSWVSESFDFHRFDMRRRSSEQKCKSSCTFLGGKHKRIFFQLQSFSPVSLSFWNCISEFILS